MYRCEKSLEWARVEVVSNRASQCQQLGTQDVTSRLNNARQVRMYPVMLVAALLYFTNSQLSYGGPMGRFVDIQPVMGAGIDVVGAIESTPSVSGDGLELFFRSDRTGVSDLYRATRAPTDAHFQDVTRLGSMINTSSREDNPILSTDGLTLFFSSGRAGSDDLYQAIRTSIGQPFENVTSLGPNVNSSAEDRGASLSADMLTLFFHSDRLQGYGGRDLYQATRTSETEPFGNTISLGAMVNSGWSESAPSVSSDMLTMIFHIPGGGMWVTSRETTAEEFGEPVDISDFGLGSEFHFSDSAPHITEDWPAAGSMLYFGRSTMNGDKDLYQATWIPEPIRCDFGGDDLCDTADIDMLYDAISAGTNLPDFDLNGDGLVDNADIDEWLFVAGNENGKSYLPGDTNFDGEVGGSDFTTLAVNFGNIGTDPSTASAYWRHGNFDGQGINGDFDVGGPDFTALARQFGHVSVNSVPEPNTTGLLLLGVFALWIRGRNILGRAETVS